MAPIRWTPERLEKAKALYESKTPLKDVARAMGESVGTIRSQASKRGWRSGRKAFISQEMVDRAAEMIRAGAMLKQAAAVVGCSPSGLCSRLPVDCSIHIRRKAMTKESACPPGLCDTPNSIVRRVPNYASSAMTSPPYVYISVPRLRCLETAEAAE